MPKDPDNQGPAPIDPELEQALGDLIGDLDADPEPPSKDDTPAPAEDQAPAIDTDAIDASAREMFAADPPEERATEPAPTPDPAPAEQPQDIASLDDAIAALLDEDGQPAVTPPGLETLADAALPDDHPGEKSTPEPAAAGDTPADSGPEDAPAEPVADAPPDAETEAQPDHRGSPEPARAAAARTDESADVSMKSRAAAIGASLWAMARPLAMRAGRLAGDGVKRASEALVALLRKASDMLDKFGPSIRDSVGWLALGTLFMAVCVWGYAFLRRPPAPEYQTAPVGMVADDAPDAAPPPASED